MATEKKAAAKKAAPKKPAAKKEAPKTIFTALFEFQKREITIPRSTRGFINGKEYWYANLDDVINTVRPILTELGVLLTQSVDNGIIHTMLKHVDSDSEVRSKIDLNKYTTAQEMGSWITYARRYAIIPLLGINTEQDVDGMADKAPKPAAPVVAATITTGEYVEPSVQIETPTFSALYAQGKAGIETCQNIDALAVWTDKVMKSTRLTSDEQKDLMAIIEQKKQKLISK